MDKQNIVEKQIYVNGRPQTMTYDKKSLDEEAKKFKEDMNKAHKETVGDRKLTYAEMRELYG